jgi:predicted ATPase/Tfp pilus assembly protein PilF
MTSVLKRHDDLIEACAVQHEGEVVRPRGEGDSRFIVFARPTNAVAAACAMQKAIALEPWQDGISLRVRMALHTGEADLIYGDYRATAADRCARLRSIGHGGQTLLSQATYDLVQDRLPKDVTLQYLGSHRLKDLQRAEQVYQLLHPDLASEFPPLKSVDSFPNNLPIQLTSFIGREQEIADIEKRLSTTRLLTLTGSGGIGKTRLALQVAVDLLEKYAEGVWFVELAEQSETTLVTQVAKALRVKEQPGRSLTETVTDFLKSKSLLLVLDNCEHLVASCAQLVNDLLRTCRDLRVLATSREPLGIGGEILWRLPSLTHPKPPPCPPLESLTQYEAVRLFIERATAVKQDFTVTNQNAPAVAEICHRLDGIPLAIALAAARVRVLSAEQICQRLESRFRLLTGGSRTVLPRQQTLQAAIDWSHELLSESERILFRRLSVFVGGWTLEAAEAICAGERIEDYEVLDLLSRLVDISLVEVLTEERFKFFESIWHYSQDKLRESGEIAALQRRHLDWFLKLAEQAEPELEGANQASWLDRLEVEHDNLRSALSFSQLGEERLEAGIKLAVSLGRFWYTRGYSKEGGEYLSALLLRTEELGGTVKRANALLWSGHFARSQGEYRAAQDFYQQSLAIALELGNKDGFAKLLHNLGNVAYDQGEYGAAQDFYQQSLTIHRELGNKRDIAMVLNGLGAVAWGQRKYGEAQGFCQQSLMIARELGDKRGIANALQNLGAVAHFQGEYGAEQDYYQQSLTIHRELGNRHGIAASLNNLGNVAYDQGEYGAARDFYQQSLTIHRELGNKRDIASSLNNLGNVACKQGNYVSARNLQQESLELFKAIEDKRGIAYALEGLAKVCQGENRLEWSVQLFGAADALRESLGTPLSPVDHSRIHADLRNTLGEEACSAAWEAGRAMTLEQAIAYALNS